MKNITLKEFKETLKGTQFESFNLEDVLNALSILCYYEAKDDKQNGLMALYEKAEEDANTIYLRLSSKGYYKN